MKKIISIILITTVLMVTTVLFGGAAADLSGTWEGPTYAEEAGIDLIFTLTLTQEGDAITGHLQDDQGYIDCEITNAALEGNAFTFNAVAETPDGSMDMSFEMKLEAGKLVGSWTAADTVSGEWTAEKK